MLRYVLHCSNFFGARLENPKINKRGVLITAAGMAGGEGIGFFFQKQKARGGKGEGAFIRDLRFDMYYTRHLVFRFFGAAIPALFLACS